MRKWLWIVLVLPLMFGAAFSVAVAQYPDVTIQQIQTVPPESLAVAKDASPLLGDTVRVTGVVFMPPGLSSSVPTGDAKMFIMDTTNGLPFSGVNVITLGGNGNLLAGIQVGDSVRITGVVGEFRGFTQVVPIAAPEVLGIVNPPTPITIDPADLGGTAQDTSDYATAEQWEGVLVKIENVTVVNDNFDNFSGWVVEDENGNQVVIAADSDSMRTASDSRGTGNVDPDAAFKIPPVGTKLDAIIGYVDTRFGANTLNPRFPSTDIVYGAGQPPAFQSHSRTPVVPTSADEVQVVVEVNDADGTVDQVVLSYQVNDGAIVDLPMNPTTGDSFAVNIPAQANGSTVTYYITATDNDSNSTVFPTGAPDQMRILYHVRDNGLMISDIQQSPYGEKSPYTDMRVMISGITTSDSLDFRGRFYIQQGSGAWNGIMISLSGTPMVARGDSVVVWGQVQERFGLTQVRADSFQVISSGNPVPDPVDVKTGDIATGSQMAESYESVLVRVSNVTVTDPNPDAPRNFGEWVVDDGSGGVRVDDRGAYTYTTSDSASQFFLPTGATIKQLIGVLDYSFGNFKLQPRNNDDFVDVATSVEYTPVVPSDFVLMQNYPNPFNPQTTIQYSLPAAQQVKLTIYNIMGQQVITLVNEPQAAGSYKVVWDGRNQRGQVVPSGLYFYRLEAGDFKAQKRMLLLK